MLLENAEQLRRIYDWLVDGAHVALVDQWELKELVPPVARFHEFRLAERT